jgi:hypothetical protein
MSITDRRLTDEEIRWIVASFPKPAKKVKPDAKPTLTLAASRDGEPDQQVASVPLEPEDVDRVRGALAGRRTMIGGDEVGFDKITNARVTMCWTRPTPAIDRADAKVVSGYDPYSRERMPGYRGDDE